MTAASFCCIYLQFTGEQTVGEKQTDPNAGIQQNANVKE